MIIHKLDFICAAVPPVKAKTPTVVNTDTTLSLPISFKGLKIIASRNTKVLQAHSIVTGQQFHVRPTLDRPVNPFDKGAMKNIRSRISLLKVSNHKRTIIYH